MTITEQNKSAFKKLGIHASREQLIVQVLKQVHWSMTTTEIAEYLSEIKGRPYNAGSISSAITALKRENIIVPITTTEVLCNGRFVIRYKLFI